MNQAYVPCASGHTVHITQLWPRKLHCSAKKNLSRLCVWEMAKLKEDNEASLAAVCMHVEHLKVAGAKPKQPRVPLPSTVELIN